MNRKSRPKRSRGSRRGGSNIRVGKVVSQELSDGPAYAGQQSVTLKIPGTIQLLATTVTTGVISSALNLDRGQVSAFATRFGSTFDEYRILGANVHIRPVAASTGVSVCWFDEKSSSAPTSNESLERVGQRLPNTNANTKSTTVMRWRARDLVDLQYQAIGTTATSAWFKLYTDTATWGAPIAVTNLWVLEPEFIIEFRGIKST